MANPSLQITSTAVPPIAKGLVTRATTTDDKIVHYNVATGQFVYV